MNKKLKSKTKKKVRRNTAIRAKNSGTQKCSRAKLVEALNLIQDDLDPKKRRENMETRLMYRCRSINTDVEVYQPHCLTYTLSQLRNACLTHNWEVATLLLKQVLRQYIPKYHRSVWRAYLLILLHLPNLDSSRIESFKELCDETFLDFDFQECHLLSNERELEQE